MSKLLINDSGLLQGGVLSPYLFCVDISDLSTGFLRHLFKFAYDLPYLTSFRAVMTYEAFLTAYIYDCPSQTGLNLNIFKYFACLFSFYPSLSAYPSEKSLIN